MIHWQSDQKNQNVFISSDSVYDSVAYDLVNKQLLDEVFVISRIIKVAAEADNPYRDLDYSAYHKNRI